MSASQALMIGGVTEETTYTYDALDQLRSFSVLPGAGSPPGAELRHTWYGHERYRRVYEGRCRGGALVEDETASAGLRCDGGLQTMDATLSYAGRHGQVSEILNPLAVHSAGEGVARVVYDHDAAGNMVARRTFDVTDPAAAPVEEDLFRYDALNRLTEVARGPPGAAQVLGQYGYNADDLRVRVRESDRNADAWYDGLSLVVERVEQGGAGGSGGGWWDTVRYHHDVGGLHAITASHDGPGFVRSTHFAHRDGLGSTLAVSRPSLSGQDGLVAASWRTDPWGLVTAETGVDHVNHSVFTGHQHDFGTGLIYMRARFYDPALGRFLTADSWLGEAGNPPSLQRYLYAYGNPGVWWDPDGRQAWLVDTPDACGPGVPDATCHSLLRVVEHPSNYPDAAAYVRAIELANRGYPPTRLTSEQAERLWYLYHELSDPIDQALLINLGGEGRIVTYRELPDIERWQRVQAELAAGDRMIGGPFAALGYIAAVLAYGNDPQTRQMLSAAGGIADAGIVGRGVPPRPQSSNVSVPVRTPEWQTVVDVTGTARERRTTVHGAERIAGPGATRGGVLSMSEVDVVRQQGQLMQQVDGATVRILQTDSGRFNVVIEGERGIITTFKNLRQKSVDRLARKYGWH